MSTQPPTNRVGTHAWSLCTNGRLTAAERWSMAPAVAKVHYRMVAGRLTMAMALNTGRRFELDVRRLSPPRTILTRIAEAHASARVGPAILNHSRRTYAFGAALAIVDGIDVDAELLYAAALLHDVALPGGAGEHRDFTLESAAVAAQIADDVGLSRSATETIASAITLHHSPDVTLADGPVAHLLSAGAALDVIGLRAWDLPPTAVAEIVDDHPRADFKHEFRHAFRAEAARVPGGRAQFLMRYAGFGPAIRLAPFRG